MDDLILNLKTHVANYHLGAAQDFKEVFDDVCEAIRRIEYYQKREVGCGDSDLLRENVGLQLSFSDSMRRTHHCIANLKVENKSLRDQLENARFQLRSLTEERKLREKAPDKSREEGGITSSYARKVREYVSPFDEAMTRKWDLLPREVRRFLLDYAKYTDSLETLGCIGFVARKVDGISRIELYVILNNLLADIPIGVVGAAYRAAIADIIREVSEMKSIVDTVCGGGKDNG